jgi:hypothetical protein
MTIPFCLINRLPRRSPATAGRRRVASLAPKINMDAEIKKESRLEIAHVLFIDIVGYSKLSVNAQHALKI